MSGGNQVRLDTVICGRAARGKWGHRVLIGGCAHSDYATRCARRTYGKAAWPIIASRDDYNDPILHGRVADIAQGVVPIAGARTSQ